VATDREIDKLKAKLAAAKRVMAFCLKSEAAPRLNAMLDLARSEPGMPILPGQLDAHPWLLNCANGTLDLRTGQLREHRREDYLTKLCPTEYHADVPCPLWLRFLDAIFGGDAGLIRFVQRLLGYCLTGDVSEQILPIFHGGGSNGKSVLVNVIMEALGGDYAMKAAHSLLMTSRGERHPTEVADLFGKRFVVVSETDQGRAMNESLAKDLTGGEPIKARRMREDFWEFRPTHKVILCTNHRPRVTGDDHAIWRRLRLVPYGITFWNPDDHPDGEARGLDPARKQDKNLLGKLRQELPGVLAWCVQGCLDWQRDGLTLPDKVRAATNSYRDEEDQVARFIVERCEMHRDLRVRAGDLYAAYKSWAERGGEEAMSQRKFGERLSQTYERQASNGIWYVGLRLRTDEPQEDPFEVSAHND
jgi:putative DNA primase/helicase